MCGQTWGNRTLSVALATSPDLCFRLEVEYLKEVLPDVQDALAALDDLDELVGFRDALLCESS